MVPFVKIEPSTLRTIDMDYVAVSLTEFRKSEHSRAVNIIMGGNVVKEAGFDGDTARVNVLEGIGNDAGTFMVELHPKGYKLYSNKYKDRVGVERESASRAVRIGVARIKHYTIEKRDDYYVSVEYSVEKGVGLLVQMPTWLVPVERAVVRSPFAGRSVAR